MATARKAAEPPAEEISGEEPGGGSETIDKGDVRKMIREELAAFFGEAEAPGPEEAGVPEEKLETPKEPQTLRQIEEFAEAIVRKAQDVLSPPPKEDKNDKAEPERPPAPRNRLREFVWGSAE